MSPRTVGRIAVLLAAAWCVAREADSCALPTGKDLLQVKFEACLHAQRPERRACETAYIAYAGTLASTHNR